MNHNGPDSGTTAPERRVLTVRQLNEEISAAVDAAFPSTVWVRGEVQRLPADAGRRKHVYFELHETGGSGAAEYQIPVSLMDWDRRRFGLGRFLDGTDPDFQIANKIEVCLECKLDFYAPFGKLSLKIVGVDRTFALGRLEARRREILAFLEQEELLTRNAAVPLPELPLRIGLITAAGSAAEQDFQTGLAASPWAFQVTMRSTKVQGERVQAEVIAAIEKHLAGGVEVIVITRGGGSRADLSWFDQKDLAVTIARCPVPVITAIGHQIDRSIADLVAHHACKTPTAAAEFLVDRVDLAAGRVADGVQRLRTAAARLLDSSSLQLQVADRLVRATDSALRQGRVRVRDSAGMLYRLVTGRLAEGQSRLADLRSRLGSATVTEVADSRQRLDSLRIQVATSALGRLAQADRQRRHLSRQLGREAVRPVTAGGRRLDGLATQVRLLDPARLLARGYTITLNSDGKILKKAELIAAGDRLRTRFADGDVNSIVQTGSAIGGTGQGGKGKRKGKTSGGKEEDTGQKTLFR